MEKVSKSKIEEIAKQSTNPIIKGLAKEKLVDEFKGDEVAQKMIQLSQIIAGQSTTQKGVIDVAEVKKIVKEQIEDEKISIDNLDSTLRSLLENQPTKVSIKITTGTTVTTITQKVEPAFINQPLIQNILSDILARNNVYLYGGAGTGKSYSAGQLAKTLGWNLITVNCNQFTTSLELIGGQTIDGYQEGKVIRAYGNLKPDGQSMGKGCVLLLDELPKIDPNTAGILNAALAQVGEFDAQGNPKPIQNARGDSIPRGNVFILATGNSLLNSRDAEYEANFKQDLSLQDRFAGSTYKVFVNKAYEWNNIINKKWAFIYIYLSKLRKAIVDEGFTSKAFVSIRLMMSAQKTYNVYRAKKSQKTATTTFNTDQEASYTPAPIPTAWTPVTKSGVKTIETTINEFYSLFTEQQADALKDKTDYPEFLNIVKEKNKIPLNQLNTQQELDEVEKIIN